MEVGNAYCLFRSKGFDDEFFFLTCCYFEMTPFSHCDRQRLHLFTYFDADYFSSFYFHECFDKLLNHNNTYLTLNFQVLQKVPNNLTEFDEYFLQRTPDSRVPNLPTIIPYMVPLHAHLQTNHLIFLILAYAPGEKLFTYIKNYAKSVPNTPARDVNLENVFADPKVVIDAENNVKVKNDNEIVTQDQNVKNNENKQNNDSDNNAGGSVDELVFNSQRLLLDVDKALTDSRSKNVVLAKERQREVPSGATCINKVRFFLFICLVLEFFSCVFLT